MSAAGTLVSPILVGRDDLLDLADRRLAEVRSGRGQMLFLAGEAGIGKTRLLNAIVGKAEALGFTVAGGDVGVRDLEVAGSLIFDLTHSLSGRESLQPIRNAILKRLTEGRRTNADSPGRGDASQRRRELVHDVADLLATMPAPSMLCFENLHWADDLSLEIVGAFARRVRDVPILALGTYRSDELYPRIPMREWRSRLLTQRLAEEARLGRLSSSETGMMTTLLLASGLPAPQDVVGAVHDRTDGIPLHVEEVLRALREQDGWTGSSVDTIGVPDTIDTTIRERLERRSPEARALAEAGSVIGRCFVVDVAAGVLEQEPERLSAPLQELIDHFFLIQTSRPGLVDFRHALIRDAIYGGVPEPTRRVMHARVAELGEGLPGAGEAFRSGHFELAGRTSEAFEASVAGARAAARWSSHREAAQLYRRALRNLPDDLDGARHAEVLEAFATEAAALDENETAAEAYEQARQRYLASGRPIRAAAIVAPLVAVRHLLGDDLETRVGALEAALRLLDAAPAGPEVEAARLRLEAGLSAAYMLDRRLEPSIEHGRRAIALAVGLGDAASELHALVTVGADLVFEGHMAEGWSALETGIERARAANLEDTAARGYRMLGSCASVLVEYDRADAWLPEGIAFAERVERWNHRHYMAAHLAHVLWATGRWDEAEDMATHALADGRGGLTTRITALHALGFVALGRGDLDRASATLLEARAAAEAMRELQRLSPAVWGLAEARLQADDPRGSLEHCRQGLAASSAVDDAAYLFPFLVTGTRAHLQSGDLAAAQAWVDEIAGRLRHRDIPGARPAIDHATGLLQLAAGASVRARVSLEAAVAGWAARRRVWEHVGALTDLATVHLRANRPAEAVRIAGEAVAIAERIGSPPLAARARAAVRAGRARHPDEEVWEPLTGREFAVARLVATGRTNAEIAQELGVAPRTVGSHMEHILAKLGVGRRAEVAAWVAENRVLHSRPHGRDREK